MKKWIVTGNAEVTVSIVVKAETEAEAMKIAESNFGGIHSYSGNGGTDKLIGVDGINESIACDCEAVFDDCMEDL